MSEQTQTPNIEELAAKAKVERAAACQGEINAALKEHNCKIDIIQVYVNGQLKDMQISILPLDQQPQKTPAP